LININHKPSLA